MGMGVVLHKLGDIVVAGGGGYISKKECSRLDMVVKLKMQYWREKLLDSWDAGYSMQDAGYIY